MKNENKKKVSIIIIAGLVVGWGILDTFYLCSSVYNETCFITGYEESIIVPLFWMSLGLLITSILTFFISDKIFKKWLKFTFWYFAISAIWIMISPESSGSFIEILATKEQVSTFASIMFVIISIAMFILMTIKEKKNK